MKKIKKVSLFFLLFGLILLLGSIPKTTFADGSVSTKGVIHLYSDDTSSSSTEPIASSSDLPSTDSPTTKPSGRKSLPSTGEMVEQRSVTLGIIAVVTASFIFFFRYKRMEEITNEN